MVCVRRVRREGNVPDLAKSPRRRRSQYVEGCVVDRDGIVAGALLA